MAALRPSLALLLLLGGCGFAGQTRPADPLPAPTETGDGSGGTEAGAPLQVPPSGRALARRESPTVEAHPEDAFPRLPDDMRLAVAETVNAERLGRVQEEEGRRVILLTPMPCRIAEQEAAPSEAADREQCRRDNLRNFARRSQQAWTLLPGRYTVRVVNREVDRPVGLWIRAASGLSVGAAGGAAKGETLEVEVELAVGDYLVSMPLLPTPDYLWQVRASDR